MPRQLSRIRAAVFFGSSKQGESKKLRVAGSSPARGTVRKVRGWHNGCAPPFQGGLSEFNSHTSLQFNWRWSPSGVASASQADITGVRFSSTARKVMFQKKFRHQYLKLSGSSSVGQSGCLPCTRPRVQISATAPRKNNKIKMVKNKK